MVAIVRKKKTVVGKTGQRMGRNPKYRLTFRRFFETPAAILS
jgi:hypothetical protein